MNISYKYYSHSEDLLGYGHNTSLMAKYKAYEHTFPA